MGERRTPGRRIYPTCCTSARCGRIDCEGCPRKPVLDEFKAWVAETGAVCTDPIWSPTVYDAPAKRPAGRT